MTPNPGVPICICLHPLWGSLLNTFHFLSFSKSSLLSWSSLIIINFQKYWITFFSIFSDIEQFFLNFPRYWTTFFNSQPSRHYDGPYCRSQIQNHWWWLGGGKNSDYAYLQNKFATATAEVFGRNWNVYFSGLLLLARYILVLYVNPNFVFTKHTCNVIEDWIVLAVVYSVYRVYTGCVQCVYTEKLCSQGTCIHGAQTRISKYVLMIC